MIQAPIKWRTCKKHGLYDFRPDLVRRLVHLYCDNCRHMVSVYDEDGACVCCGSPLKKTAQS